MKTVAQSLSLLPGGLAILGSVLVAGVTIPAGGAGGIGFGVGISLLAVVGSWAVAKGRAWGPLLLALWMAVGLAVIQINFADVTGIAFFQGVFVVAAILEVGAAIVLAKAPRSV